MKQLPCLIEVTCGIHVPGFCLTRYIYLVTYSQLTKLSASSILHAARLFSELYKWKRGRGQSDIEKLGLPLPF